MNSNIPKCAKHMHYYQITVELLYKATVTHLSSHFNVFLKSAALLNCALNLSGTDDVGL